MRQCHPQAPPADVLLDVINGAEDSCKTLLRCYEGYINAAARRPVYDGEGHCIGVLYDQDLMQDMRLNVFKCIPALRKNLILYVIDPKTLIVAET